MQVPCVKCQQVLTTCAAGISTCPRGDEVIESYYFCAACDHWTVESARDQFMTGEDLVRTYGKSREAGDRDVALIAQCPTPHNKFCRCNVHDGWD